MPDGNLEIYTSKIPFSSQNTYQGSVATAFDAALMNENVLLGRSIITSWLDESVALFVGEPLDGTLNSAHLVGLMFFLVCGMTREEPEGRGCLMAFVTPIGCPPSG